MRAEDIFGDEDGQGFETVTITKKSKKGSRVKVAEQDLFPDDVAATSVEFPSDTAEPIPHITTEQAIAKLKESTYSFLTGVAGSGKSYTLSNLLELEPGFATICATTGIAGVNLGVPTINSLFKYFDTNSLEQKRINNKIRKELERLAKGSGGLVVDEVSMMDGLQLQIIHDEVREFNHERRMEGKPEFRLILTGDFAQLPPVKAKYAFEVEAWEFFGPNTIKLTKVWRQTNPHLLDGLNAIRRGDGPLGAQILSAAGCEFASDIDPRFDGTTLISKNDKVDRFNLTSLARVDGSTQYIPSRKWQHGQFPPSDWKNIPDELGLKIGAFVMILANDSPEFTYANGDCGHVEEICYVEDLEGKQIPHTVNVRLTRNNELVTIPKIIREWTQTEEPYGVSKKEVDEIPGLGKPIWLMDEKPVYSKDRKRYIVGQIEFMPLRLAYATTIHKSQGLSLDKVQIDLSDNFFGSPAMAYVALSRCKTLEGLRLVGSPKLLANRVSVDPKVRRFV